MAAENSETPRLDEVRRESPKASTGTRPKVGNRDGQVDDRYRARVRLGKRWTEILVAIKRGEYTWQEFVEGLDEEELARGQLKDAKGGFRGRAPTLVPREFHLACQREQQRRFEEIFSSDVLEIARQYVALAKDAGLKPETKAKMMQYAMERIFGGIPKDVRVSQAAPWEQVLVNVVANEADEGMPEHLSRRYEGYAERQGAGELEARPGED